ncbi:MAG: FAD:protein FMN transferase [Planctomycetes bacterium]|nr:FAD:protein FMN transferase [Planctomycetota bacterium]
MPSIVRCRRPAMASLFEVWLTGEDEEHLTAVGEAALDEISRIERLFSFFDPASEVSRINREAADRPVKVDVEMFGVLSDCLRRRGETGGYFDITIQSDGNIEDVVLDATARTVHFMSANVEVNLGGYGKGYALDAAGGVIREQAVASALLHGGTSSILAVGAQDDGTPWKIGLRDPYDESQSVGSVDLVDAGFSTSGVFHASQAESDIMNPQQRQRLTEQAACAVIAPTALDAEVWSTAFLAMGESQARGALLQRNASPLRVAWLSQDDGRTRITWLNEEIGQ